MRNFLTYQYSHFNPLINACQKVKIQKNLINRFREKYKNVDFGLKNLPFTHLGLISIFIINHLSGTISKKPNEYILRKVQKSIIFVPFTVPHFELDKKIP